MVEEHEGVVQRGGTEVDEHAVVAELHEAVVEERREVEEERHEAVVEERRGGQRGKGEKGNIRRLPF